MAGHLYDLAVFVEFKNVDNGDIDRRSVSILISA